MEGFTQSALEGELVRVKEIQNAYEKQIGRKVVTTTIYRLLHRHGWRKITPRPKHPKFDAQERERFKKLPKLLRRLRRQAKQNGCPLRVMFQDEARFGLIRSLRPCWACKPIRPELPNRIARQYTYVYGAVSPLDGRSDFLVLPSMQMQAFDYFLKELSNRYSKEHIAMVVDGAASHRTNNITVPENMTLIVLPPIVHG